MSEKIRFYLDENIPNALAKSLRQHGVDIVTTSEAEMRARSDVEQLQFALRQSLVCVTKDEDFLTLHAQGVVHGGIVFLARPRPISTLVRGLLLLHQVYDANEMANKVEYL